MDHIVLALKTFDDGSGTALYAAGVFSTAGGETANRIARWDGASWSALGSGVTGAVRTMAVFDDGQGAGLYVGGEFTSASGVAANRIARWDGASWSPLGSGMDGAVDSLRAFDDGSGAALHVGSITNAIDSGDSFLAKWGCESDMAPPVISCPASVQAIDPNGSPPGEIVTFSVTASDDRDPAPSIVCVPPSGSFFPRGTTLVHCTAEDDIREPVVVPVPGHGPEQGSPEAPRRPSGGKEGEAAGRSRRGGGSASPATKDSAQASDSTLGCGQRPR